MKKKFTYPLVITLLLLSFSVFFKSANLAADNKKNAQKTEILKTPPKAEISEKSLEKNSFFKYLNSSDWVISGVLLLLVLLSITCWGLSIGKLVYLENLKKENKIFIENFWQESSLKNLSASITKFPYSPAREIFRESYKEFQRNSSLQKEKIPLNLLLEVSLNSLSRSLQNAKRAQRKKLETYLPLLAITASTAPFIGLFGTVWGIMNSFEAIALTGNASLTSVAPGLSEALIATAFGLAAAIPSAIGYSLAGHKIRNLFCDLENFSLSFINIIEKHLVLTNKSQSDVSKTSKEKKA